MSIASAFSTSVHAESPTDSTTTAGNKQVSDFITVGSFTNFSATTGALSAAWGGLRQLNGVFEGNATPFALCFVFGLVSLISSRPGRDIGKWAPAAFITAINCLTLFSAVLGVTQATT